MNKNTNFIIYYSALSLNLIECLAKIIVYSHFELLAGRLTETRVFPNFASIVRATAVHRDHSRSVHVRYVPIYKVKAEGAVRDAETNGTRSVHLQPRVTIDVIFTRGSLLYVMARARTIFG